MDKVQVGSTVFVPFWPLYDDPCIRTGVVISVDGGLVTYVIRKTIVQHTEVTSCYDTEAQAARCLVSIAEGRIGRLQKIIDKFSPKSEDSALKTLAQVSAVALLLPFIFLGAAVLCLVA